jgi:long-subunit acyl-CoA synthetase (AMP-forming)/predicted GNAT family acetyltransferase
MKSSLTEIRDKVLAGRSALEQNEAEDLIKNLRTELSRAIKEQRFNFQLDLNEWADIFTSLFDAEIAEELMLKVDKDLFFTFGEYLNSLEMGNDNKVISIVHNYLNLFRVSGFLQKIYGEYRWEYLVHSLILKSSYTFNSLFSQRVNQYKKKRLFRIIKGKSTIDYGWDKTNSIVTDYSSSMRQLLKGIPSENRFVAFLLENSIDMILLDLACLTSGIVNVMIPANSVPGHIIYILNQSKSAILFADDEKQLSKIRSVKKELKYLKTVVMINGNAAEDWIISFSDFKALQSDKEEKQNTHIEPDSLATIMYTSGTTGEPKGIMFSHMNIVFKRFCRALAIPGISDKDRYLAFLPLYHTFGRYLEMTGAIFWGAEYCFMENPSVETMISNMQHVKPSIFISIPKKWIQLYEYITTRVDIEVDDEEKIQNAVSSATGGELRWGLSAAGYLPPDIFRFFQRYGIELMSGFGMTEATGGITMTPPYQYRENSLGKALPGIEIKLGDDGEILIRGPYVMTGYYDQDKDDTFTSDGWLPTGDVMKMDDDGFIEIIDRKKEIYKNVKGETIAPQKIENLFRDFEFVKQVFLVGDHLAFNTVLIFPDEESPESPLKKMDEQQKQEYFSTIIVTVNNFLAPFERIVDFRLIDRPFSENFNELTPKGTYKRRNIEKNFDSIIQSMYKKDYLGVPVGKYEIKIPNWFLREKGALNRDIKMSSDKLTIPKLNTSLTIKCVDENKGFFQVGNYIYSIGSNHIDLQSILTNPYYWLGNLELNNFAGEGIFQWYRKKEAEKDISFVNNIPELKVSEELRKRFLQILNGKEISLLGLHYGTIMLQSENKPDCEHAVLYFRELLSDETNIIYRLAYQVAYRPQLNNDLEIRRGLFRAAVQKLRKENLKNLLTIYLDQNYNLLNDELILYFDNISRGDENLSEIEQVLHNYISGIKSRTSLNKTPVPSLIDLLISFGINHPLSYKHIRRLFLRYELYSTKKEIRVLAKKARMELRVGLRKWLGLNLKVAIDPETGEEYRWEDVLVFEQDIDEKEIQHLKQSLIQKPVIREAVFLFSDGVLVTLNNLLPSGVWISILYELSDRKVYRVAVQTRFQGSYDITLHVNKNISPEMVDEEIKWIIIAGTEINGERLASRFGGLWEEYSLWTEEFNAGDSVARFIQRESRKNDEASLEKIRSLWKFFGWNAASAYIRFWKLAEYKLELVDPSPENIIVTPHDYQTGCILTSFANRQPTKSLLSFFMNFYNSFVQKTEEKYPFIKKASISNSIFSALIEVEGYENGIKIINKLRKELIKSDINIKDHFLFRIDTFLESIKVHGFLPKQLYFAIKRFHRWFILNKDASLTAQAQMLYELYDTYRLFDLELEYPATRTRFFLETVFSDSKERFKIILREIVRKQRERRISREDALKQITGLQFEFELSEKEEFFLARLGYPHLKPGDTAALLKMKGEADSLPNLVVQLQDYDGNSYLIRHPINPKEISRLHQLFIETNLNVNFRPEHQYLIAISDRGFVIGGLFYYRTDEETVHMEKIVVANRYRKKGISEGLMNELFSRLKGEKIRFVTTGFFRPEYFYRFNFKIERKYAGLVKEL